MATKKDETIAPTPIDPLITTDAIAEKQVTNESKPMATETTPAKKYPTDLLRHLGFNVCDKCGAQFQNDFDGRPVCPEQEKECPRLK